MKMKKSQLKEAVKAIVRQTLSERLQKEECGSKFKRMAKHVAASEREQGKSAEKAKEIGYATANKAKTDESKQLAERIAKLFETRTGKKVNPQLFQQIAEEAVARPTLPPNKGSYKKVAPHAYTTTGENEPLTIQTDPEVNEGGDKWIQKAVKHPGRCAHMGSPECPEGSPQYNLAKRFKSGDIHKDNTNEAGMTSEAEPFGGEEAPEMGAEEPQAFGGEEPTDMGMGGESPEMGGEMPDMGGEEPPAFGGDEEAPEMGGEHGGEDERMEIKLIKLMGLCAKKLELMHQGMPGDEATVSLPPEVEEPSAPEAGGEEEPAVPFKKPEGKKDGGESESEPKKEKKSKSEGEPKKKEKKGKKDEDPTEFTKKLAKECSYKVQKRSYRTSKDTPYADPKNVQNPEIPGT